MVDRIRSLCFATTVCLLTLYSTSALALGQSNGAHDAPDVARKGAQTAVPMCGASDLSLGTDAENGSFDGMSHSGTLLVLRNLSAVACRVELRPEIGFVDGAKPLPITLEIPGARFMHPGPVMMPVVIPPGAEVTSKLRWVSSEVYDSTLCFAPTAVTVRIRGEALQAGLSSHICGDKTKGVTFEATPLAADPRFKREAQQFLVK